MTETILNEVIKYLVPTLLAFITGFLLNQVRMFQGFATIVKWVSRRAIIDDAKFYIEQGYITPKQLAEYEKLWNVYHKRLKGNSEGEAYYNLVKQLEVRLNDETK